MNRQCKKKLSAKVTTKNFMNSQLVYLNSTLVEYKLVTCFSLHRLSDLIKFT